MADEFVKHLSLDISKSLTELQKLEKAFVDTMDKIDKAMSGDSKVGANATAMKSLKELQYIEKLKAKSHQQSLDDARAYYNEQKKLDDEYQKYLQKIERQQNQQSLNDTKQELKDRENEYRAYLKREEALAKEARKAKENEEKAYWDTVKNSADNALEIYTNVMRKVVNVIANGFRDALKYVKEYDKALTSISLVTMKPESKDAIGEAYENIAREMSVTATELASAGEELYRQGLGDDEVLGRMEAITTYAKISGETFSDSVEMITAAVNSFAKEGEDTTALTMHIVDVWAKLGDAVATSASEIGVAMQKVAASGQAAGFTMEELSASIAVIESQTRAAAESVGTALNSMMSRYMKVSSAGWNTFVTTDEGDVVKINDIAKALESVGISIVDAKGEFLDFSQILINLHGVWNGLTDANKNYIATQMAGTRSLNYFLSLMNNYDEVLDLTAQGYDSAGVALEKYGIWAEGVEASQNRLSATMQDFYSNVINSETVIKFIDALTALVGFLDRATEASGKANIGLGLFISAVMMGVSAFGKFKSIGGTFGASLSAIAKGFVTSTAAINGTATAATGATVAVSGLKAAMMSIGIGLLVTAITSVVSGIISMREEAETSAEKIERLSQEMADIGESLEITGDKMASVEELTNRLEALGDKTVYTADEIREFNSIRDQLIATSPQIAELYGIESQAVNDLGTEYERTIEYAKQLHTELAMQNWKTAADGMKSALETLQAVDESRYGNDDTNVDKYYDIGFNLSDDAKKHEITRASNTAYDAYMEQGYTNVHELQQLVDEHSELLTQYDEIVEDKWAEVFGSDSNFDINEGYLAALEKVNEKIAQLQTEMEQTGDKSIEDQISNLYAYEEELKNYYDIRSELTSRQMQYTQSLADAQAELAAKEREAWDVIVRGSSRANEVIAGYGYDLYETLLNSLMGVDFAAVGIRNDQLSRVVTSLFDNISDEVAGSVNTSMAEIDRIIGEEIPEGGITKEIIDKMAAEDDAVEAAIREWSDGLITSVQTAADPYVAQWNSTMQTLYENLANAVTDPMQMDILKTKLENSDLSLQIYAMLAQAMTKENIDVAGLIESVLSMNNDESAEFLMDIVVVPEVEIDSAEAEKKLSEQIAEFIKSYKTYSGITEMGEKLELGVELNAEDLQTLAEAAESLGFEDIDLSTTEGVADAVERVAAALLLINGEGWDTFGVNAGSGIADYEKAVGKRNNMQTLTDGITGIASEGADFDVSGMLEAYPQLIQYAGDLNTLRDEAIILLNAEKEANGELLEQYGLQVEEVEALGSVLSAYARGTNKAEAASKKLSKGLKLTADECKGLIDEYPELAESLIDYADGAITAEEMIERLNKAADNTNLSNLSNGLADALADYDAAIEGSQEATAALERMGFMLSGGMGDMSSLDFARQNLDLIRQAVEGDIVAFQELAKNAVVHIVGSADVDFSAVENGLIRVGNISEAALEQLAKLGMFEITYVTAKSRITTQGPNGEPKSVLVVNKYPAIKFKDLSGFTPGSNSSGGGGRTSSGGGGGGGGGGSTSSVGSASISEAVEKMLDEMEEELDGKNFALDFAKAWEDYFNSTGELGKTIPYMEEQIEIYKEMVGVYKENADELRKLASSKKGEITSIENQIDKYTKLRDQYKQGSSAYKKYNEKIEELRVELESLEMDYDAVVDKLRDYELSSVETEKAIQDMTDAIKEQKAAIRQQVIDMKNQLRDYYDEIDDAEKDRLDATVSMQDKILEVLKERAEKEIEYNTEVLEDKKKALEEEMDLIRKNFNKARELAEKDRSGDDLAAKQAELAQIIADPTRAAERAALEKEIADMQSEMAWDAAEEQIAAQEEAKQNQIDAIDAEIENMEKAYDDISEYSEEMINEMYSIMQKSSADVVAWLTENSNEYAESTKEAQQQLIDDWTETMNKVKGILDTGWTEVDKVMGQGLDAAIDLLKQTDSYKAASPEEQESMVENLREQWNDMKQAQKQPEPVVKPAEIPETPVEDPKTEEEEQKVVAQKGTTRARYHLRKGYSTSKESILVMPTGATVTIDGYHGDWYHGKYKGYTGWVHKGAFSKSFDKKKLKKYQQGGLVDYTGFAWLDGQPGKPEMVLNADDTKSFKQFIMLLEKWRMPDFNDKKSSAGLTVEGDIIVKVGDINTGDDYEDVGQKVMDAIYNKFKVRR